MPIFSMARQLLILFIIYLHPRLNCSLGYYVGNPRSPKIGDVNTRNYFRKTKEPDDLNVAFDE